MRLYDSTAIIAVLITGTLASQAMAQAQPASAAPQEQASGDIVVTAQRREERLIDVPQSVTALSADSLQKLGATQFRDFANTIAGLSFQTSGAGQTQITLRGVGVGTNVSSTVGVYVDEVPYGTSTTFARSGRYTPDGNLFDISRIEVLRGPQGTLYGAAAMGGVLKYVSTLPNTEHFSADAHAGVSSTRFGGTNYDGAAAVNLPIATDKVGLRVSGFYTHDGGFIDNPRLGRTDVNRANIYGARADLLLKPSEALTIRLAAELQNINRQGTSEVDYTVGFTGGSTINGPLTQDRFLAEPFRSRFRVLSGTINYDLGGAKLTSVTSYQQTRVSNAYDYTKAGIFGPGLTLLTDVPRTNKFTQELRLAKSFGQLIDVTVGGFYTHEQSNRFSEVIYHDPATGAIVPNLYVLATPSKYDEYAGFGNLTVHLSEKLSVTGGVRVARNQQTYVQNGTGFAQTLPEAKSGETVATYLANARYEFSRDASAYLRFATGYRPGGPNFQSTLFASPPSFASDHLYSYEAGFKGQTRDRTFGIDIAIYHIDWKNIQTFDLSSPFGGYINGPRATIDGGELALTARPARGLTFSGAFAYQDAKLAQNDANFQASKGEPLPNVPKYTASINGDYELPFGSVRPTVGATLRYVSERVSAFNRNSGNRQLPSYTQVDLRLGATIGPIDTQLYVHNLFDTRGQLFSSSPDGLPPRVAVTQPRTIGISGSVHFR